MMKKYIIALVAACMGLTVTAQSSAYKMKINMRDGSKLSVITDEVDSITFAKLGKVQATLSERYKTSTSLGVNIDIDVNASRVKAVCVPASQTIGDVKAYVEKHATVDAPTSYKKAFDFLSPETDYVVYALAYDTNGLASEMKCCNTSPLFMPSSHHFLYMSSPVVCTTYCTPCSFGVTT